MLFVGNERYRSEWEPYSFPKSEGSFSSTDDIKANYFKIGHGDENYPYGGLPVLVDDDGIFINKETEMTLIFGETGSKKTRCLISPLICNLAKAGESMVIMDVKGELSGGALSPKIRGVLDENGYNTIFLNFRDLNADCFNILLIAYNLYKQGEIDRAMSEVSSIVNTLASVYNGTRADPFWTQMATAFLMAITFLVFETAPSDAEINMLTIASYTSEEAASNLLQLEALIDEKDSSIMTMLRSVLSAPEKTRQSILASAAAFLQVFLNNETLATMLGQNTFNLDGIHEEKTALFVILPDEVNTYDEIAGLIMKQISGFLVTAAYNNGGTLKRRVNFIYDEFCNIFSGDGCIGRALSTHRSRNIRYYLVCQGLEQLKTVHPRDYATILTNSKNIYYLNSSDRELLKYLSEGSGITYENMNEVAKPLISIYDLQTLKKSWENVECYIKSGNMQFVTKLPDIDQYKFLDKFNKTYTIPARTQKALKVYNSGDMLYDVRHKIRKVSFRKKQTPLQTKKRLFN